MTLDADALFDSLAREKERFADDEPDRFAVVRVKSTSEQHEYVELLSSLDPQIDLARALYVEASKAVELPHAGWVPLTVTLSESAHPLEFALEGSDGPIRLRFADGSERALPVPSSTVELAGRASGVASDKGSLTVTHTTDAVLVGLDDGPALWQPITVEEFGGIEALIGELYKAQGRGELEVHHAQKILELAELLRDVARATTPGETPRWRPIGAVRAVLHRLFQNPFRDALALSELLDILKRIRWHDLYEELQQLLQ